MYAMADSIPQPGQGIPLGQGVVAGGIMRHAVEDIASSDREYFELNCTQLEPGPFVAPIHFIAAKNAMAYRESYPRKVHSQGELAGRRFGFGIPVVNKGAKFAGEEVGFRRLCSAVSGEELDLTAEAGFEWVIVLVDQAKLMALAEAVRLPENILSGLSFGRQGTFFESSASKVRRFGKTICQKMNQSESGQLQLSAEDFESFIFDGLLGMIGPIELDTGRPPASVVVRRAIELADSLAHRGPVRIVSLCAALKVSQSTMEKSFKEVFGLTPNLFFRQRNLNLARLKLIQGRPEETTVSAIAQQLGFREMGRFAVRYRELFGESPSESLRRQDRCTVFIPA